MVIKKSAKINSDIQESIIEYFKMNGVYEVLEIDEPIIKDGKDHTLVKIRDTEDSEYLVDIEFNNEAGSWAVIGFM